VFGLLGTELVLDGGADLAVADGGPDLVSAPGPIGAPCATAADCAEGKAKVCFRSRLYNLNGFLKTPGGYCYEPCVDDTDCGAAGTCVQIDPNGKFCWATCTGRRIAGPGTRAFATVAEPVSRRRL